MITEIRSREYVIHMYEEYLLFEDLPSGEHVFELAKSYAKLIYYIKKYFIHG